MFEEFKKAKVTLKPNYKFIPVTMLTVDDIDKFNEVYLYIYYNWSILERTPSGGIKKVNLRLPTYDAKATRTSVELTVLAPEGFFRLQMRFSKFMEDNKGKKINGYEAFKRFKELCELNGIDLNKYAIKNGEEVKKEIEKTMICFERDSTKDVTFYNAHHIDFHNSFPAGLVNTHPEFAQIVNKLYKERKTNPENKSILNCTIGFMQSEYCNYRWAHLSRDAINDNNKRIRELEERLKANGNMILAYNTDGIWYCGDVYHGEGEGAELGQWENDHINCQIRFKSAGSYEYIENGIYKPVVRGTTRLELSGVTRDKWNWGDIYNKDAKPLKFKFIEGVGIIIGDTEYEEF